MVAPVLSYVDPDKADGVIEQLESRRQINVMEAIATTESASPAAIKNIEVAIEQKFLASSPSLTSRWAAS